MDDVFIIERSFDAPRQVVFDAWTKEDALKQWFGPKEFPITHCTMDFREGGMFHYAMKTPGGDMWGRWVIQSIQSPASLEVIVSFSNEQGEITRAPFNEHWPLETLSTTNFTEEGGRTKISIIWQPHNASVDEIKTFTNGKAGMEQGWAGTFQGLENYLTELK